MTDTVTSIMYLLYGFAFILLLVNFIFYKKYIGTDANIEHLDKKDDTLYNDLCVPRHKDTGLGKRTFTIDGRGCVCIRIPEDNIRDLFNKDTEVELYYSFTALLYITVARKNGVEHVYCSECENIMLAVKEMARGIK